MSGSVAQQISSWVASSFSSTTVGGTTVYDLTAGDIDGGGRGRSHVRLTSRPAGTTRASLLGIPPGEGVSSGIPSS